MIMENEEILQQLSNLNKKTDKILRLVTTIAKTLHIVPVSEKEERDIQLLQRKNAAVMQKIQEELAKLEEVPEQVSNSLSLIDLFDANTEAIYEDIIGDDFISR
jgi:precorrin-2 methylase